MLWPGCSISWAGGTLKSKAIRHPIWGEPNLTKRARFMGHLHLGRFSPLTKFLRHESDPVKVCNVRPPENQVAHPSGVRTTDRQKSDVSTEAALTEISLKSWTAIPTLRDLTIYPVIAQICSRTNQRLS